MTAGVRLQNALGFFKLFVLVSIIFVGMAHFAGVPGLELKGDVEVPGNLRWSKLWENGGSGATAFVTGLYSAIWYWRSYPLVQCPRFAVLTWETFQDIHGLQ